MESAFLEKVQKVKSWFADCKTEEEHYEKLIALGREAAKLPQEARNSSNLVEGCQSQVFLLTETRNGKIYFQTESDALISSGLAHILVYVYSGEKPEVVLKEPPQYLEELGIPGILTPSRANGLYSIHLRIKKEALRFLVGSQ